MGAAAVSIGVGIGFHHPAWFKPPVTETKPIASAAPSLATTGPSFHDDFDLEKRNREIRWREAHHGVPTMTFTRDRSNVLCLKPEAVIALPEEVR